MTIEDKHTYTLAETFLQHSVGHRKHAFTLAETFLQHSVGHRKHAFTLAETLITLGVIGVVAAMVLPSLLTNFENKKLIPRVKKAYSTLAQSFTKSQILNASPDYWDYSLAAQPFYEQYLKDYILIEHTTTIKEIKDRGFVYHNMNGDTATEDVVSNDNTLAAIFADGTYLFVSEEATDKYKTIALDVNGTNKPNIIGKDTFMFTIQEKYGFTPYGYGNGGVQTFGTDYDITTLLTADPYGCREIGAFCSAYLIYKNWEMGNDYPR